MKSAWAERNGKALLKNDLVVVQQAELNKQFRSADSIDKARKNALSVNETLWERLKANDSLEVFGLPNIYVRRKFKKSIRSMTDISYTKQEIFNLAQ